MDNLNNLFWEIGDTPDEQDQMESSVGLSSGREGWTQDLEGLVEWADETQ